jgi:hypothetical protein
MRAPADRVVKGRGRFGVCEGGLQGDGDIHLCVTVEAARLKILDAFRSMLDRMTTNQWMPLADLDPAISHVEATLAQFHETVDGFCLNVEWPIEGFTTLRMGIFRCDRGARKDLPESADDRYRHDTTIVTFIPYQVRLARSSTRVVVLPEPKSKGRKR